MAYIVENDIVVAAITRQLDTLPGKYTVQQNIISIKNIKQKHLILNSHQKSGSIHTAKEKTQMNPRK